MKKDIFEVNMSHFNPSHFAPKLPQDVLFILQTLYNAGYEAYIVGGCVRDMILCELYHTHKMPNDYDIATSALPKQVSALFAHSIPTGAKYGTISVIIKSHQYEITTFRIDGAYLNARSPQSVRFTPSLSEDLKRRDFTINALAYAPHTGLIDEVGGVADIVHRRIMCVGEARLRFTEDALRILRALRFSATLGFLIESTTKEAILDNAPLLLKVAKERVRVELSKLLGGEYAWRVLSDFLPLLHIIIPQLPMQCDFSFLQYMPKDKEELVWSCFLHPCAPYAKDILESLKFSNKCKERILTLLKFYDMPFTMNIVELRHIIVELGGRVNAQSVLEDVVVIKQALLQSQRERESLEDITREGINRGQKEQVKEMARELERFNLLLHNVLCSTMPLSLGELCINGADLKGIGIKEGKRIGEILQTLLVQVLEEKIEHTPLALLAYAQTLKKS